MLRSNGVAIAAGLLLLCSGAAVADQPTTLPDSALWFAAFQRDARLVRLPDGRKLDLYCIGTGSPTVLLESGIGGSAFDWRSVQDKIAKLSRVCAYDRAGLGRSTAGPMPRDVKAEVADLEALLKAARLPSPYVLVGHSMGGYNVRLYAFRHPDSVAGLVLVDPSVEDQIPIMEAALPALAENDRSSVAFARRCGDPKATAETIKQCTRPAPDGFPPDLAAAFVAAHGPASLQAFGSEVVSFIERDSQEVAAERRSLGAMPLIVLTRGLRSTNMTPEQAETEWTLWNRLHEDLAKLSSAGVHRVVPGADHYIQVDQPDAVVAAVDEVLVAARSRRAARN